MKIYTKTGDTGETSLYGGKRISKAADIIDAYGTVDELNSWIGVLAEYTIIAQHKPLLRNIQDRLFRIGALLSADPEKPGLKLPELREVDVTELELAIDKINDDLQPLANFIIPGGHKEVAFAHVARTVCRRAERCVLKAQTKVQSFDLIIKYLNRLSDFIFVLCRHLSHLLKSEEVYWTAN
jgi:cob(I)alamin adenosyltransferase